MLDFKFAAERARSQDKKRVQSATGQMRASLAVVQRQRSFRSQLFDALKKQGTSKGPLNVPDQLFVALPEKLLEKWCYVSFGSPRSGGSDRVSADADAEMIREWNEWKVSGEQCHLRKLDAGLPKRILLTHGLSPIEDTTLLLADLGRGVRVASGLQAKASVMVADTTWMSHNRSIRKFDLSDDDIEKGLVLCLDRRQRLYKSLRLEHRVHSILGYEEEGEINGDTLERIVDRYRSLVGLLWGPGVWDAAEPLDNDQVQRLTAPLGRSLALDSPLRELTQFPGGIEAIERGLGAHLDVLKTLAKRFRHLNSEVLSYYFTQYYAQAGYRGTFLKVAVISEKDFDEPFDELDSCFSAWGVGHKISRADGQGRENPGLSGVYLPQYRVNGWSSLPYTPLSSDALKQSDLRCDVVRKHLPMINDQDPEKIKDLLSGTLRQSIPDLNRIVFDLLSFVSHVHRERGRAVLGDAQGIAQCELNQALAALGAEPLVFAFGVESEEKRHSETGAQLGELWASWLDTLGATDATEYTPSHLLVASLTRTDWNDRRLAAATSIVRLANAAATVLIGDES